MSTNGHLTTKRTSWSSNHTHLIMQGWNWMCSFFQWPEARHNQNTTILFAHFQWKFHWKSTDIAANSIENAMMPPGCVEQHYPSHADKLCPQMHSRVGIKGRPTLGSRGNHCQCQSPHMEMTGQSGFLQVKKNLWFCWQFSSKQHPVTSPPVCIILHVQLCWAMPIWIAECAVWYGCTDYW